MLYHNVHVERPTATNSRGEQIVHHKYRKQSNRLDATPVKDTKHYKHISELIAAIFEKLKKSVDTLKQTICLPDHHPVNTLSTVAHSQQPGDIADIVKNRWLRFSDQWFWNWFNKNLSYYQSSIIIIMKGSDPVYTSSGLGSDGAGSTWYGTTLLLPLPKYPFCHKIYWRYAASQYLHCWSLSDLLTQPTIATKSISIQHQAQKRWLQFNKETLPITLILIWCRHLTTLSTNAPTGYTTGGWRWMLFRWHHNNSNPRPLAWSLPQLSTGGTGWQIVYWLYT